MWSCSIIDIQIPLHWQRHSEHLCCFRVILVDLLQVQKRSPPEDEGCSFSLRAFKALATSWQGFASAFKVKPYPGVLPCRSTWNPKTTELGWYSEYGRTPSKEDRIQFFPVLLLVASNVSWS